MNEATNRRLAAAVADMQAWLHDTRRYPVPQQLDFRAGAIDPPGLTVNVNLGASAEDVALLNQLEREAATIARRLRRLDAQTPNRPFEGKDKT